MDYVTAAPVMAEEIHKVLQTTIQTVYPRYYPKEVVDFFCRLHSKTRILEGIASGNVGVLREDGVIVGTGCFDQNHITGVYVLPHYQGRGFGSHILKCLEAEIRADYETSRLDASIPAVCLYERRGYHSVGNGVYGLENGVMLVYEMMEKKL